MATDCSPLCVNLTAAAASHAQVMGVLAGFAVASLAVVLQRPKPIDGRIVEHHGIPSLFAALIAFVSAAFFYGTAGADRAGPAHTAQMILAAGLAGAVAISELAFGLLGLLLLSAHEEIADRAARYGAVIVPWGVGVYFFVSAVDVWKVGGSAVNHPDAFIASIAVLGGTQLILLVSLLIIDMTARSGKGPFTGLRHLERLHGLRNGEPLLAALSIGLVVIAAAYFLMLFYMSTSAPGLLWLVPFILASWVIYATLFAAAAVNLTGPNACEASPAAAHVVANGEQVLGDRPAHTQPSAGS